MTISHSYVVVLIVCCILYVETYARGLEETYQHMLAGRRPTPELRTFLSEHPEFINTVNDRNETVLHIAAECGDTSFAEFLISSEADLNSTFHKDKTGTPLAYAIHSCRLTMVKLLLKHGAEPDGLLFYAYGNSCNPFEKISPQSLSDITKARKPSEEKGDTVSQMVFIDLLIKNGANPNERDAFGNTLMHELARQGDLKQIQFLLGENARPDIRNKIGVTPRDIALMMIGFVSLEKEDFLPTFEKIVDGEESKRVVYPTMIRKFRDFLDDFKLQKNSFMAGYKMQMLIEKHGITLVEIHEYGKRRSEYTQKQKSSAVPEIESRLRVYQALLVNTIDEDAPDLFLVIFTILLLTAIISTGIVFLMKQFS